MLTSGTAPPPMILLGLDSATGVQVARALAAHRVPVVGITANRSHWAARTRAVDRVVEADHGSPAVIDILCDDANDFAPGSVLLPCTDASVLLVAAHADRLRSRYRFAQPDPVSIAGLLDKATFATITAAAGVPTARSVEIRPDTDVESAVGSLESPCVIKPTRKDSRWLSNAPEKAIRVEDPGVLVDTIRRALEWSDHLIVQEWIPGPDTSLVTCNCYIGADGTVQATVVSEKIRQWPPGTGTGSSAVTVDDPAIAEVTARILSSVGFTGLGYVEFKRRAPGGDLVAIEANVGRPTGRSTMAEAAGVDMLYAFYADLAGVARPPLSDPAVGVVWLHIRRDAQAMLRSWRRREAGPRELARSLRGRRTYALASWSDPMPFLLDLVATIRKRVPTLPRPPDTRPPDTRPPSRGPTT